MLKQNKVMRPLVKATVKALLMSGLTLAPITSGWATNTDFDAGWAEYQSGVFSHAVEIWKLLAEAGNAEAQFNLSVMYEQGRGVDADPAKAKYWNDQALKSQYPPALHNQALALLAVKQNDAAVALLRTSADKKFPASLYTLGKIYQLGIGLDEDPAAAFKYVRMAAQDKFANAQYNLGKMYRDGYGVTADEAVSAHWFEAAAAQGLAPAQNRISDRYATGQGVAQDDVQALKWAILAGNNGIEGALQKQLFLQDRMSAAHILQAEQLATAFSAK